MVEKEILLQEGKVGMPNQFSLLDTPRTHPECFPEESAASGLGSYLGSPMPMAARETQEPMPRATAANMKMAETKQPHAKPL